MAKKPASMKVVDGGKDKKIETVDVTEELVKFKEVEEMKLNHMIEQSQRIDFWCDVRKSYEKFDGCNPTFDEVTQWTLMAKHVFEEMLRCMQEITVEDVTGATFKDPYAHLIRKPSQCSNDREAFEAMLIYSWVVPIGSEAERFFYSMQDKLGPIDNE